MANLHPASPQVSGTLVVIRPEVGDALALWRVVHRALPITTIPALRVPLFLARQLFLLRHLGARGDSARSGFLIDRGFSIQVAFLASGLFVLPFLRFFQANGKGPKLQVRCRDVLTTKRSMRGLLPPRRGNVTARVE